MSVQTYSWLLLVASIAAEVAGTIALRYADGFTRPVPSLVVVASWRPGRALAGAQGVKISTVFAITEAGGWGQLAGDFGFGGGQVSFGRMEKMSADSGMAGALLAPKQITLQKSVNVIYKLNP